MATMLDNLERHRRCVLLMRELEEKRRALPAGLASAPIDGMPHGAQASSSVERITETREEISMRIGLLDGEAHALYRALLPFLLDGLPRELSGTAWLYYVNARAVPVVANAQRITMRTVYNRLHRIRRIAARKIV